jgi:nicotinamide-nucleotide amidase
MPPNNRRQALVPEGAEVLANPNGTAPGLFLREGKALIFLLPGPPRELKPMMADQVTPALRRHKPTAVRFSRQLKVASEPESRVDYLAAPIYQSYPEVETTILSSPGVIELFFRWTGAPDQAAAQTALDELQQRVRDVLGESVFTDREESLETVVGGLLAARGKTLATAESCTGGWISKLITDTPGSSAYFRGGVVAYSNDFKETGLGVDIELLRRHGAVSEPVAGAMAEGVRRLASADWGLATTGIAGPGGGCAEKPVGLICFGLAGEGKTETKRARLLGDREAIRLRASRLALDWLRRRLT